MMERQALSERLVDQLLATLQAMPNVTSRLAEGGRPTRSPKSMLS
ncbi:hypothetical protein [Ralstonia solanacearum]|nr:hypothetical protein [Ralstonia solanacearum]